jgi:Ran-interacting Mog1 protein
LIDFDFDFKKKTKTKTKTKAFVMSSRKAVKQSLWGGSASILMPLDSEWFDCSQIRQIPDNQEVFSDMKSDRSIIVELLEADDDVSDGGASRYHFMEIAHVNSADDEQHFRLDYESALGALELANFGKLIDDGKAYASIICGRLRVAKFREQARNTIGLYVAVIRLKNVATDVVLSFNDPIAIDPSSSSAMAAHIADQSESPGFELFKSLVQSFIITNWSLFG